MGKAMSIAGIVVGGVFAIVFALDLITGFPFGSKAGPVVNIGFAMCGAILAYLGWSAFRESL